MRLALALTLAMTPALAQETTPIPAPLPDGEGFSLVEEGARLVLRGLMKEMQPALDEMGKALDEVGPALEGFSAEVGPKLQDLLALIDDFKNYDAPVKLPNGDILIRRNAPRLPAARPVPGPNGETDL